MTPLPEAKLIGARHFDHFLSDYLMEIMLCGVVLLLISPLCVHSSPPTTDAFEIKCLERHFWLSVKSHVLGSKMRFDFEDQSGYHILSEQEAALCGYTVLVNAVGELVFRASFLACHVHTQTGSDYHLRVWFVNVREDGELLGLLPFQLHCPLQEQWSSREIVCEENYMEVSLYLPDLPVKSENDLKSEVGVVFHRADLPPEESSVMSPTQAAALGYHISLRPSQLTLRCRYSSPLSYITQVRGVYLEVASATIIYRHLGHFLAVNATVSCALNQAAADGSDLLWVVPSIFPPLVQGRFRDGGLRVGVGGRALTESEVKERRYEIGLKEGRVEIRIPMGGPGGDMKSGVIRGRYGRSMCVDLFFMSQWEDERWPLTQLRAFRLLKTPLLPQTLFLTRNPVPSEGLFSVTLGPFAADVSLRRAAIDGGGDLLTWTERLKTQNNTEVAVYRLSHANGSISFSLSFPLSHPRIVPEFIGAGSKTYSFTFSFTLNISTQVFYHQGTMEHSVDYTAPPQPTLEGKCLESSLLVLLHHGAQAHLQWDLYMGSHRLDWELVETGGMEVEAEDEYVTVQIPMDSAGVTHEELTLRSLVASVNVSVVDPESLKVQDTLVHRCTFPVRELLVCFPEGRMVAVVDTSHTLPPTPPDRTALLDPSCAPTATDSARALFDFSLDSCGTTVETEGSFLVYENQIGYNQDFLPPEDPVIHRDSPYRMTVQCRYPANYTGALALHYPVHRTPLNRTRKEAAHTHGEGDGR